MPLQPPATTRAGRLRRAISSRRARSVSAAPTERPQVPAPTTRVSVGVPLTPALSPEGRGRLEGNPRPRRGRGPGEGARPAARPRPPPATRPRCSPSTSTTGAIAQSNAQSSRSSVTAPSARRRARRDAEAPLARGQHVQPAPHPAREPHADPDHAPPRLGQPELGIVRRDAVHLGLRHAQMVRRLLQRRGREPAIPVLERVQRGQQPGPLAREAAQGVGGVGHGAREAQRAAGTGSRRPASAKPFCRSRQESQAPQARPSGWGS